MTNRKGSKRSKAVPRKFVTKAELSRKVDGFSPKGTFDPPSITTNPWNQVVLVSRGLSQGSGAAIFTTESIFTLLKSQLGLTGLTAVLVFSIRRVGFWLDTRGDDSANLGIQPTSFLNPVSGKSSKARTWIEDVGTKTRQAHCHYVWPEAEQQCIFQSDASPVNILVYDTKAKDLAFTVHFHVLWRSNDADQVPSFRLGELLSAL